MSETHDDDEREQAPDDIPVENFVDPDEQAEAEAHADAPEEDPVSPDDVDPDDDDDEGDDPDDIPEGETFEGDEGEDDEANGDEEDREPTPA